MLCHTLALILLAQVTHPIRTAYVTSSPLIATIDRILEKLENLTVAPTTPAPEDLSDDEEEALTAMQTWGKLTPDQLDGIAKDFQRMKAEAEYERTHRLSDLFYIDDDNDEEYSDMEYRNDGEDDEDMETRHSVTPLRGDLYTSADNAMLSSEDDESLPAPASQRPSVTPAAITRGIPYHVISAVEPITATNKRPRIMNDSGLTAGARKAFNKLAFMNIVRVHRERKCQVPQRKWFFVRKLVLASGTFLPPWVVLHRCDPDCGCNNDEMTCAPISGRYVIHHFYHIKPHETEIAKDVARVEFYNHTECACVFRNTLQANVTMKRQVFASAPRSEERQNDWRAPVVQATFEPKLEEDVTAPPQLRKCTCPTTFLASLPSTGACSCGCFWRDANRRRDCHYLSRGNEHLGLRDRVCIENGDCDPPTCEYGAYDPKKGKCPKAMKKRDRFHEKRLHQERNVV